ncbi:RteC domain-containing protein [Zunongwangia profunda]|nr:RteC domain-containing protein [Zunongwangia profunda]|tara:strand:+ start:749 stop:1582 length:834 start_codon:yes stop_codon:yes gene_type:complete
MFDDVIYDFHNRLNAGVINIPDPLKKADTGIELCNLTLSRLKELIEKEDFENVPDEIDFFKNIKPCPMSYLIYFTEVRSCELRKPKAGDNFQLRFFEKELRKINKFFHKNNDFVHYMEQGHVYMDHQLFTRNHRNNYPFTPMINYYQYPEFSTSHDMLWSKVQAMYRFIHYIRESIQEFQTANKGIFKEKRHKIVIWSGSKTALVELIYALYATGDLNHGIADLSTITSSFEDCFNIKLENFYKTYSEIKARKGNRTKYLQNLILNLEEKMARDDEN